MKAKHLDNDEKEALIEMQDWKLFVYQTFNIS